MVSGCVVRIPVPVVPIDLQVSLLALPLGAAAVARSARGGAGDASSDGGRVGPVKRRTYFHRIPF